jgi:hypothetical protein
MGSAFFVSDVRETRSSTTRGSVDSIWIYISFCQQTVVRFLCFFAIGFFWRLLVFPGSNVLMTSGRIWEGIERMKVVGHKAFWSSALWAGGNLDVHFVLGFLFGSTSCSFRVSWMFDEARRCRDCISLTKNIVNIFVNLRWIFEFRPCNQWCDFCLFAALGFVEFWRGQKAGGAEGILHWKSNEKVAQRGLISEWNRFLQTADCGKISVCSQL